MVLVALLMVGVLACAPGRESGCGGSGSVSREGWLNGLVAYTFDGDLYVGDPVTGETTAIVTDPEYEVNPVFSPDGNRIAFVRGDPQTPDSTIVVVRVDGSDERVILPEGREHRGFLGHVWTPDGTSLLVQLDHPPFLDSAPTDGEISLFDADGSGSERVLMPPLERKVGIHYFLMDYQVAPMFRPPTGEEIVEEWVHSLRLFDPNFETATPLGANVLEPYEPYVLAWVAWSPDGTRILFNLGQPVVFDWKSRGLFVMGADGETLQQAATEAESSWGMWSPDGTRIAFSRQVPETDEAVLAVVDLDSGEERILESTSTVGKEGARFPTVTYNNVVHHWYYEGWMWAPDGCSLLVLEDHRTHPWVVDIESDTVVELPWLADSMPSWQRIPADS